MGDNKLWTEWTISYGQNEEKYANYLFNVDCGGEGEKEKKTRNK